MKITGIRKVDLATVLVMGVVVVRGGGRRWYHGVNMVGRWVELGWGQAVWCLCVVVAWLLGSCVVLLVVFLRWRSFRWWYHMGFGEAIEHY